MCLDLFLEETSWGSILVNNHLLYCILGGGLQEVNVL